MHKRFISVARNDLTAIHHSTKNIHIMNSKKRIATAKKLLNSKWTAVHPSHKEKHFMVTKLIVPEQAKQPIEYVEIEAIHSKRVQQIAWQTLNNTSIWLQGWV